MRKMTDPLDRYRQAWIQEQADQQKQLQAEEEAHRDVWRQRATEFIAKHDLADLLAMFRMGDAEFPISGWDIVFPLQIPHNGKDLPGTFSLFSEGGELMGAIECEGHGKVHLPASDAQIGHWLSDLDKWSRKMVAVG